MIKKNSPFTMKKNTQAIYFSLKFDLWSFNCFKWMEYNFILSNHELTQNQKLFLTSQEPISNRPKQIIKPNSKSIRHEKVKLQENKWSNKKKPIWVTITIHNELCHSYGTFSLFFKIFFCILCSWFQNIITWFIKCRFSNSNYNCFYR